MLILRVFPRTLHPEVSSLRQNGVASPCECQCAWQHACCASCHSVACLSISAGKDVDAAVSTAQGQRARRARLNPRCCLMVRKGGFIIIPRHSAAVCLTRRGSGPGAKEERRTIKFALPPVPKSVTHGLPEAKGFHFPASEGFIFEAAAGEGAICEAMPTKLLPLPLSDVFIFEAAAGERLRFGVENVSAIDFSLARLGEFCQFKPSLMRVEDLGNLGHNMVERTCTEPAPHTLRIVVHAI